MRARGLKRGAIGKGLLLAMSRPMRARGLKLANFVDTIADVAVAPHAGAWIETCPD